MVTLHACCVYGIEVSYLNQDFIMLSSTYLIMHLHINIQVIKTIILFKHHILITL